MSDLEKAAREAAEAAESTEVARQIAAILAAQQLLNGQQSQQCQHAHAPKDFDAKKWLVIGGVTVSVGLVGALFAVVIAIGACCATVCLLILRSIWREYQKGR